MRNKAIVLTTIFCCICAGVYSETIQMSAEEEVIAHNFIDSFKWYQRFLPAENLGNYHALRNFLIFQRENSEEDFRRAYMDLAEPIQYLQERLMESIDNDRRRVKPKRDALMQLFGENAEVIAAVKRYEEFSLAIANNTLPVDYSVMETIDKLYSQLITRLGYVLLLPSVETGYRYYEVVKGDYLTRIAIRFFNDGGLWRLIYYENIDNRHFLPNPKNPHLIFSGVRIRIPPHPGS